MAQEAGVNERTVYRHFTDERGLRDAVMRDLELDAGIDLADLGLADIAGVAARIFDHISSYTFEMRPLDPTMTEALLRQREALHDALEPWTTTGRPRRQRPWPGCSTSFGASARSSD